MKSKIHKSDKPQTYLDTYLEVFAPLKDKSIKLLELGVYEGGSLLIWKDFFTKGRIVGIDINHVEVSRDKQIKFYCGRQEDTQFLEAVAAENAPKGFDIIIDDASHFGKETFTSFIYLFKNHLKPGGIYVIEDWGTGFWPHYPDGRNLELSANHISKHLHTETDYKVATKGFRHGRRKRFHSHDYGAW